MEYTTMYVWVLWVGGGKRGYNHHQNTLTSPFSFFKGFKCSPDFLAPEKEPQIISIAVSVLELNTNKT